MAHNTPEQNEAFRAAWNATNARYIAGTLYAIHETFNRRHGSIHVRKACLSNIAFYKKMKAAK